MHTGRAVHPTMFSDADWTTHVTVSLATSHLKNSGRQLIWQDDSKALSQGSITEASSNPERRGQRRRSQWAGSPLQVWLGRHTLSELPSTKKPGSHEKTHVWLVAWRSGPSGPLHTIEPYSGATRVSLQGSAAGTSQGEATGGREVLANMHHCMTELLKRSDSRVHWRRGCPSKVYPS